MVPKRQIQLKKKKDTENIINQEKTEKLQVQLLPVHLSEPVCLPVCLLSVCLLVQVILKDVPAEGGGAKSELSANELLCTTIHHRPDQFLRQHSMPASLHTHSTTSSDVDSYRIYKGLVAGANQGNNTCTSQKAPSLT